MKRHAGRWIVFTSLTLFTSFVLALGAQQKPPVFRTRIDLMQLDVTVLDKKGDPVRGLTAADFILLEDNKPQTIEAFTAVDLPDRVDAGPRRVRPRRGRRWPGPRGRPPRSR